MADDRLIGDGGGFPAQIGEGWNGFSFIWHRRKQYPPVMTNIANWNMAIYNGFSHEKLCFYRPMLNYQRVYIMINI